MSIQKFRPYMTIQQIRYIVSLVESDCLESTAPIRNKTLKELKLFIAKSDIGAVSPSITTTEKKSMSDKLGFSSPELSREESYNLWRANPQLCTESQIKAATLYRYENDLMSPEEEQEYEQSL